MPTLAVQNRIKLEIGGMGYSVINDVLDPVSRLLTLAVE